MMFTEQAILVMIASQMMGQRLMKKVKQGNYATMLVAGTSGQGGNFTEFMKNLAHVI